MIMSVHDPLIRKRELAAQEVLNERKKRARTDPDSESVSDQMFSIIVQSAIDSLEKNDSMKVNALTDKINLPMGHRDAISFSHFSIVLRILIANISKLDSTAASAMVSAILRYKWLKLEKKVNDYQEFLEFLAVYAQFINVLVSSYPKYLQDVIGKLISEFADIEDGKYPHHDILRRLVTYIPTCINSISQFLASEFPHHLSSSTSHIRNYVGHCMKITKYCPDLQFPIWQMIMQCCIKLDVELQNEIDDMDDDLIEELINESDLEMENESDTDMDMDDDADADADADAEVFAAVPTSTQNIKALVSKLDTSLDILLSSTKGSFTAEEIQTGNAVSLYNTLSSLFKTHVLPTHFTKSVQFLMFHISQYQPELADSFLVLLIDVAFNPSETTEKRLKALQYLASYISRAKNLTTHQVVFIVSYLIGWINKYISEREREVLEMDSQNPSTFSSGGMERFKLFYATFQALLYIFCFRHKQLARQADEIAKGESEWECGIDKFFQRVIIAKFNPLKYCDETVVYIFAKIATKLNVCYCYSIIEHNKRERMIQSNTNLPSSVGNFRHKQEFLDLEAYFPFDPMVLPKCKAIVGRNYVEWKDVNPADDDDDDDEDDTGSRSDDHDLDDEDEDEDDDDDDDDDDDQSEDDDAETTNTDAMVRDAPLVEDTDDDITSDEEDD